MVFDEKNYPINYEKFEKRVIELFLEDNTLKEMFIRVEESLSEKPHNFLEQEYKHSCARSDLLKCIIKNVKMNSQMIF